METMTYEREFKIYKFKQQLKTVKRYLIKELVEEHCKDVHIPVFMVMPLMEQKATEKIDKLLETGEFQNMYAKAAYYEGET